MLSKGRRFLQITHERCVSWVKMGPCELLVSWGTPLKEQGEGRENARPPGLQP